MMVAARRRHRVSFSSATIHYFPMCLSDNPSVRSGVALGMGGPEACRVVVDVDEHMPLRARPRRPCPWIHPEKRREILAAEGASTARTTFARDLFAAAVPRRASRGLDASPGTGHGDVAASIVRGRVAATPRP